MNTHMDQLEEWYGSAEKATPRIGDTYIAKFPRGGGYEFGIVDSDGIPKGMLSDTRILARSEKPTPAWHDAVAVTATYRDDRGVVSGVWTPVGMPGHWEGPEGDVVASERLESVTPLIEARVTDGMVLAAINASLGLTHERLDQYNQITIEDMRAALHAALGVDPA